MFSDRVRQTVTTLQSKSPQERMRAAVYITVGVGIVVVLVWLIVLLPIQLYFVTNNEEEVSAEESAYTQLRQQAPDLNDLFAPNPTVQTTPPPVTSPGAFGVLPSPQGAGTVEPVASSSPPAPPTP